MSTTGAFKSPRIAVVPKAPEVESKLEYMGLKKIFAIFATYWRLDNVVVHGYIIVAIWARLFNGIQYLL